MNATITETVEDSPAYLHEVGGYPAKLRATKNQRAMAIVMVARDFPAVNEWEAAARQGISIGAVGMARMILHNDPELAEEVAAGRLGATTAWRLLRVRHLGAIPRPAPRRDRSLAAG
jgi:hypothetical protein